MITKNLEVIGAFGARGSAKTTKLMELLKSAARKRVFVYDLKDEYPFKKIRGRKELFKFLQKSWYSNFKISYVPDAKETQRHIEELSDICFEFASAQQHDEKHKKGNDLTIVVEEMSVTMPNQKYSNGQGGFPYCVNVAREWGIEVIGVSQRPAQANMDFRGNSTQTYYFNLSKKPDVEAAKFDLGDRANELKNLQVGEFLLVHRGQVTKGRTKKK